MNKSAYGFGSQLAATNGAAISGHTQEETAKRLGYSPQSMAAASFQITFLSNKLEKVVQE